MFTFAVLLILSLNAVSGFFHYPEFRTNDFRETTEFTQTTQNTISDYWNFESTKRTITERTEVRKRTRTPIYSYSSYSPNRYGSNYAPSFSNWRYKEPFNFNRYDFNNRYNNQYNDYYYKPRFDSRLGYFNWRY